MPGLLICIDGSATAEHADACRRRLQRLLAQPWTHTPQFVDRLDEVPAINPGDLPVLRTVGFQLALPEPDDRDTEDAVRRDVEAVITAVSQLAAEEQLEFVVEYEQEEIGFLDGGPDDARVVTGFFGA